MTDSAITPAQPETLDLRPAIEAAAALGKDGVEVLERLHAIQKEEREATAKAAFVAAMNELRAELPRIIKKRDGQHGVRRDGSKMRGRYAPLDDITEVVDPYCAKHGFIYEFGREIVPGRDTDYVTCVVTHEGGHERTSRYPAPAGPTNKGTNALQAIAVGETYARRYAFCAAFGITTADEDLDGADDGGAKADPITDEQFAVLSEMVDEMAAEDVQKLMRWLEASWKVTSIADLPSSAFDKVKAACKRALEKRGNA